MNTIIAYHDGKGSDLIYKFNLITPLRTWHYIKLRYTCNYKKIYVVSAVPSESVSSETSLCLLGSRALTNNSTMDATSLMRAKLCVSFSIRVNSEPTNSTLLGEGRSIGLRLPQTLQTIGAFEAHKGFHAYVCVNWGEQQVQPGSVHVCDLSLLKYKYTLDNDTSCLALYSHPMDTGSHLMDTSSGVW